MPPQSSSVSIRCLARIAGIPRLCKKVWGAATWQTSQRHHTLFLLFIWPVFCFGFHYIFPLLILYATYHKQQAIPLATSKKKDDDAAIDERLERALETLNFIDRLERAWDTHCHWQMMTLVVSAWIGLITVFQPWQVMWIVGTVFVLVNNPLVTAIWKGCMPTLFLHSLWLALVHKESSEKSDGKVSLTQHVEDFQRKHMQANTPSCEFEFVLYENQRSWPLSGWKTQTFPIIDRATWTDSTSKPVRPKSQFELPETIHAGTRTWTWQWAEKEWRLANPANIQGDELGWMYGTPFWSVFGAEHKGWISTRRRRWARKAVLSCMPPPSSRASLRDSLPTPVSAPASTSSQQQQRSLSINTTPSQTSTPTSPPVSPTPSKKGGINLSSLTLDSFTSSSNLKRSQTQSTTTRRESGTSWKSIVRVKR